MSKPRFEKNICKSSYNNITETEEKKKPESVRRKKWSVFHIMFNTNKTFHDIKSPDFLELQNKLVTSADRIVGSEENQEILKYVIYKETNSGSHNIEKIKVNACTEIGDEQHRLHIHMMVAFFHNTLIKLNYEQIRKAMEESVGIPLAFWAKIYSKADFNILNYVNKYNNIQSNRDGKKNESIKKEQDIVEKISCS